MAQPLASDHVSRDSQNHPNGHLPERQLLDVLWDAASILEQHGLITPFGHVSVRSQYNHQWFYLVRGGEVDIGSPQATYEITAGEPIGRETTVSSWSEHYIHASLYDRYPHIGAIVHSHDSSVLPFSIAQAPQSLRPVIHMAGFLGVCGAPVFVSEDKIPDFMVNSYARADSLTSKFVGNPDATVVLQQSHGFTAVGKDLAQAVYRAIYTQENAKVLTNAKILSEKIHFLTARNVEACTKMNDAAALKAFADWQAKLRR